MNSNIKSRQLRALQNYAWIEIKHNNAATNDPCAVCGDRCDPIVGPEFFFKGTWALVCLGCVRTHAPWLESKRSRVVRIDEEAEGAIEEIERSLAEREQGRSAQLWGHNS